MRSEQQIRDALIEILRDSAMQNPDFRKDTKHIRNCKNPVYQGVAFEIRPFDNERKSACVTLYMSCDHREIQYPSALDFVPPESLILTVLEKLEE